MKYMLIPLMLIACGDKEEDSASPDTEAAVEEQSQENEEQSSEAAE